MHTIYSALLTDNCIDRYSFLEKGKTLLPDARAKFYTDIISEHGGAGTIRNNENYDDQPKSIAQMLGLCKGIGPPSWGLGETRPTIKPGLGRYLAQCVIIVCTRTCHLRQNFQQV